jgi:uncharacterized protein YdeI (YjbR/CyaY-like superfamily)
MESPLVSKYIANSAEFAQPILKHIRSLIHKNCPDVVEEIKWSFPVFMYKGMLCNMAAFKNHCAFGFWKSKLIPELEEALNANGETAMGQFGRLTSVKDLPSDKKMSAWIKQAMKLNDEGAKVEKKKAVKSESKKLVVPDYFIKALTKNKSAKKHFDAFSPSQQKEYVDWITEAKTEATRDKRLTTSIEWMSEGKKRLWKYERKV